MAQNQKNFKNTKVKRAEDGFSQETSSVFALGTGSSKT